MTDHWHATIAAAARPARDAEDGFAAHAFACMLAVAVDEAASGTADVCAATGLSPDRLDALLAERFPAVDRRLFPLADVARPTCEPEEEVLRDLLLDHLAEDRRSGDGPLVATMIARRAMRPDHLWQDLGLFDRAELGRLLALFFPVLHAGNTNNMRWKKYFYRRLCEAEGFALCSAPSCAACTDFADCFGAEDGESRMAERRRAMDLAITAPLAAE